MNTDQIREGLYAGETAALALGWDRATSPALKISWEAIQKAKAHQSTVPELLKTHTKNSLGLATKINDHLSALHPAKRPMAANGFRIQRVDPAGRGFEATTSHGHTEGMSILQASALLDAK